MSGRRCRKTANGIPAKGRLKEMADRLWSLAVRADWNSKCAVCGHGKTEAHHLIPRQHNKTRHDLRNGIALCSRCHKFDRDISPHQNAAGWLLWLEEHHPLMAEWYEDNCRPELVGKVDASHYMELLAEFRQYVSEADFERIVGIKLASRLT